MGNFYIKEAFRNIRVAPFLNIISVMSITLALCLVGFFGVILYNTGLLIENISEGLGVEVYLKQPLSSSELNGLIEKIKGNKRIKNVEYFSASDDRKRNKELIEKLGIKNISDEILPSNHGIKIEFKVGTEIKEALLWLETLKGVEVIKEPPLGIERIRIIIALRDTARLVGYILIIMIIFSAIFFVVSTINLSVHRRMDEFEIMLLCGATPRRLRIPLFIEGFLQGFLGSIIAFLIVLFLSSKINEYIGEVLLLNVQLNFFPHLLFVWILIGGITIGVFGTIFSSARHLRV